MIEENDWLLLTAYADNELEGADLAAFEERLASEPRLQIELDRIRKLKRDLRSLRPFEAATKHQQRERMTVKWLHTGTMVAAACLIAVAMALFAWRYVRPGLEDRIFALHNQLARQTYVVDERKADRVVSTGRSFEFNAPDMTPSRLFLVDVESATAGDRDLVGLHYRGLKGCRMTLVAFEGAQVAVSAARDGYLTRTWSHGGFGFVLIAGGMDAQRFKAVGEYAEAVIEEGLQQQGTLRLAMSQTAKHSCA